MTRQINKILIANRGEIAVRVMRACKEMGITSVAVFSDADKTAYHVRMADEAYNIGPAPSSESYLNQDRILNVAKECSADAIHPGYGFLAENASFAKRCAGDGIIFIGPDPETITLLGDKITARKTAIETGLPVLPGAEIDGFSTADALAAAQEIGFPVLIKATAGGGGKGMRLVESPDQFAEALKRASSEALSAFSDGRVFIEKFLEHPRHIEIQILADKKGNCVHLGERECSIQRRHQKLIEESPSPFVDDDLRKKMGDAAVSIAHRTNYVGVGTVEFMVDSRGKFYFLEVNTRLQVEHPVTEMVTGIDLVKEQIKVAEGRDIPFSQDDISFSGHAIECRICAEDPQANFMPSTGKFMHYRPPGGPGVRVDAGVVIFSEVPIYYDPLIAKLIVWGKDRAEAIGRAKRALEEYRISGVKTTIGFHRVVLENKEFVAGNISTGFLAEHYPDHQYSVLDDSLKRKVAIAVALDKLTRDRKISSSLSLSSNSHSSEWKHYHRRNNLGSFGDNR